MSLINEALKKAQRDRHLENVTATAGGNARAAARAASVPSKSTLILIGTVGFALFVAAVVGTVLFINRDSAPKAPAIAATSSAKPAAEALATASSPIVAAPVIRPVAPPVESVVPPPIVLSLPSALNKTEGPAPTLNSPAAKGETPPPAPAADKFDPRLQLMVDGWKVNLVRVAGAESRLFMNGSSYRIGDVIDRTSGLRLTAIADTTVTFTDSAGSTYVKRH